MKKVNRLICFILAVSIMLAICSVAFAANDVVIECEEEAVNLKKENGDSAQQIVAAPLDPGVGGSYVEITNPPVRGDKDYGGGSGIGGGGTKVGGKR